MPLQMWKMVLVWIFLQLGFGAVSTKKHFLMLRSLIRMPQAIGDRLCTAGLRRIKGRGMSRGFERLKWLLLHF